MEVFIGDLWLDKNVVQGKLRDKSCFNVKLYWGQLETKEYILPMVYLYDNFFIFRSMKCDLQQFQISKEIITSLY